MEIWCHEEKKLNEKNFLRKFDFREVWKIGEIIDFITNQLLPHQKENIHFFSANSVDFS